MSLEFKGVRSLPLLIACICTLLLALLNGWVGDLLQANREIEQRKQILWRLSSIRANLEQQMNASLFMTQGFEALLNLQGDISGDDFTQMAKAILSEDPNLINVGLAPDYVLRYVYPLAGNEAVVGFDYRSNAEQWPGVLAAIESGRSVIVGPLKLIQGGWGIISRRPLFVEREGRRHYWGLISIVVNSDRLLAQAQVPEHSRHMQLAISRHKAAGQGQEVFFGSEAVLTQLPIEMDVTLPSGSWRLAALPRGGWESAARPVFWWRLAGYLMALLIGGMLYWALVNYRKVVHLASHDPLTGLPNRRLFFERLAQALELGRRGAAGGALLLLDLDKFKPINDCYGHKVGDLVLQQLAVRMKACLARGDTLSRLGGDEFLVMLPGRFDRERVLAVATRLAECVRQPLAWQGVHFSLEVSIGICAFPRHGRTAQQLIACADGAMYQAKRSSGCGIVFAGDQEDETSAIAADRACPAIVH